MDELKATQNQLKTNQVEMKANQDEMKASQEKIMVRFCGLFKKCLSLIASLYEEIVNDFYFYFDFCFK